MSALILKLIAMATMVIDHVGAVLTMAVDMHFVGLTTGRFVPMRLIGRLAFPIYAFLIAQGCAGTRSMKRYMLRLGIFALISQPCYMLLWWLVYGNVPMTGNVMFTLALGAFCIFCWQQLWASQKGNKVWKIDRRVACVAGILAAVGVSALLQSEFSPFGLLAILAFYIFRVKGEGDADGIVPGGRLLPVVVGMSLMLVQAMAMQYTLPFVIAVAVAALPLLLYNRKPGSRGGKWVFYVFYPAHLLVLSGLAQLFLTGVLSLRP